jgi:ribosomal protein L37AE/L43A
MELLERDGGCGWCGESSDSSAASIEYRVPPPKGADAVLASDGLVAVCASCQQTEKRSVRFPRGLLVAAAEVEEMGFSEMVRVALAEWLRSRQQLTQEFEEVVWTTIGEESHHDFLLKTPSIPIGIDVKSLKIRSDLRKMMVKSEKESKKAQVAFESMLKMIQEVNALRVDLLDEKENECKGNECISCGRETMKRDYTYGGWFCDVCGARQRTSTWHDDVTEGGFA